MSKQSTLDSTLAFALLAATALLSACSKGSEPVRATQIVATVNGQEITVHQLNDALAALNAPAQAGDAQRREVTERLIDRSLAAQRAIEAKLDRTAEVMTAIESAKQEIIAKAYLRQVVAALPQPTKEEAAQYYAANPDLFARRRVYELQELLLPAQGTPVDALQKAAAGKSLDEIAAWLKQQNIRFATNAATRGTDEIPLELVPRLAQLKDGQIGVFAFPQTVSVVRVVASRAAPVSEIEARPRILQFLGNQRANAALTAEIKRLRDVAKIDYALVPAAAGSGNAALQATPDVRAERATAVVPNLEKTVSGLK